jgi:TonB-linked SusC/RagA family outer membrane protein
MKKTLKKTCLRYFLTVLALCLCMYHAKAQTLIKGRIVDTANQPLPGVTITNISLKEKSKTISNGDGEFSIAGEKGNRLEITMVGYANQQLVVQNLEKVNITLRESDNKLDEVVVVGYGTQKQRKLTSAVATIFGEEINKRVATSPATLLQGQLPGLQVVQNSAEPGNEAAQLRIRGVGTFSGAGNDPLVIVDGIPGSLSILNPNDIESVSVLKDAASSAIYGSRGANGVLVIKTKKGKNGGFNIQYTYNIGFSKPTQLPDLITNSAEFMELSNEARTNSGLQPLYTNEQIELYRNATDRVKYPNHNWLEDLFKTGTTQNHYLNMSGGKENTTYSFSIGYTSQDGTMIGYDYDKYTVNFGLNSQVSKRVVFGSNIQMRYSNRLYPHVGASDMFLSALAQSPLYPAKSPDGRWINRAYPNELGNKNVVALVGEDILTRFKDYYAQGNVSLDVDIIDGLKWENRAGMNFNTNKLNDFRKLIPLYYYNDMSSAGFLDVGTPGLNAIRTDNIYTVVYSQFSYKKQLGDHNISALAGYQQEYNNGSDLGASRLQYPTNELREIDAGPTSGQTNSGKSFEWALRSFYGNAYYDYQDKYLFGTSLRYDGTSRLPADKRWGLFYSFSAGWRISKEKFMENISWIDDLKLRASLGELGNQNIPLSNGDPNYYPYQPTLSNSPYPFGGKTATGFVAGTLVDPMLKWETTRVFDLGIDATLFKNKLSITADWYNKYTFDIIRQYQVPIWLGLGAPVVNNGAMRNKGLEIDVKYKDIIGNDFTWYVGGNIQGYKNTLERYGKLDINNNGIREEGHPLDEFYLYQWDGIFQSQQEIDNSPKQPVVPKPGDLKFKDVNGDNVIDDKDRTYTPGRYPKFQYTFNFGASWKGIDFSAQFYGSQGQQIYVNGWGIEPFVQGSVPTTDWRNRWTPTNPSNTLPRIYVQGSYPAVGNYNSTYFLKEASFLRLKNIQLGYSVPQKTINKAGLKSLRVFFTADNILTISNYPGLDPERVSSSGSYVSYPQSKTYTFGASVQF